MIPRVQRMLETALYCADSAQTADFYQQLLNVTPMLSGDCLVALDAGHGTVLLLFQHGNSGALETPGGLVPGHDGFRTGAHRVRNRNAAPGGVGVASRAPGHRHQSRVQWEGGGTSLYFATRRTIGGLATPGIWPTYLGVRG